MGNLFIVYGDVLSEKLRFLADVIVVPAYGGEMKPRDEMTDRLFELAGRRELERAIREKYNREPMNRGEVRGVDFPMFLEKMLFVYSLDEPLWSLESKPQIEKHLIVGYHNAVTVARLLGYDNVLIPFFGMSLTESENEKMIKRITRMLLKELSERRRGMDIYFVIPECLG